MRWYWLGLSILLGAVWFSPDGGTKPQNNARSAENLWVDSVMGQLSPRERISQLFMVAAYSNKALKDNQGVTTLVKDYNVGGIIFFQGGPLAQAGMTNYWQGIARTPLLIAIDGEWGLGMRLKDSTISYPKQMTLGAIQDPALIYQMGAEIARHCRRLGIHINFAPVVDVNSNASNPVINYRSFGESPQNVALRGIAYMKGMQDNQVMSTAKHFPGHGDTDKDSHHTLPLINHSKARMDSVDLYPFRELIRQGLYGVMVAHLYLPAFDQHETPTTLSYNIITRLLKEEMGFKGLVITDALGMAGVTSSVPTGELEVRALEAGNDILLMSENMPVAVEAIEGAVKSGRLKQAELDARCRKVLQYKYRLGLHKKQKIETAGLYQDLNDARSQWINRILYESSVTLIRNADSLLPLRSLDTLNIACVSVGRMQTSAFQEMLSNYAPVKNFNLPADFSEMALAELKNDLAGFNLVIIGLHSASNSPSGNFGINRQMIRLVKEVAAGRKVVLDLFANPYALSAFGSLEDLSAVLVSYQDDPLAQQAGAEAVFGGIRVDGRLPVGISADYPVNSGLSTPKVRLKYTRPEDAGLKGSDFQKVDSIATKGVIDKVYPGCQVLIAVDGKVIYLKSFGTHTYESNQAVRNSDLYDLASVTKIAATTISIMKLYEEGKIDIDQKLVKYLPELDSSNKSDLIIRNLMAHQARLKPFIPFYKSHMINGKPDTTIFRTEKSAAFPYRVAEQLYIRADYPDTLFTAIINSDLRENSKYKYSDLGFMMLKKLIETTTNQSIDRYLLSNFYKPLGLTTLCYEPRKYFSLDRIIPSEQDTFFRHQLLQGDVNDPTAAMFGGIQGHAGLFSNSNDIAILLQMLIQGGSYGGQQYFMESTVKEFTRYQFKDNRRGLGFDKPMPDRDGGPTCKEASDESFGHSGFTGTYVWADPRYNIVYVFLSNRTCPYSENNRLLESGIRTLIQQVIYKAVLERDASSGK